MGSISVIALLVALEAGYIFISLRAILGDKLGVWRNMNADLGYELPLPQHERTLCILRNAGLFFGIIAANLVSGILHMSPFRHLLFIALLFGLMKLVCRERILFYNMFLVSAILGIKATLEMFIVLTVVLNVFEFSVFYRIICNLILLVFAIVSRKLFTWLRDFVDNLWQQENTFYVRYCLNIGFIASICMYIYVFSLVISSRL